MRFRKMLAGPVLVLVSTVSEEAGAAAKKYAVAMPHFNIQYVAGGMVGFWPTPDPRLDLNAEQIEDQIVKESFEPVLDLFLKHPTWATDVEMQGYMLDVIAARHPLVLAKLKELVAKEQLEVVSFHYSDQLFIAHAPEDWEHSADLVKSTFAKVGIPIGGAVFCQEGQAGMGMAAAMKRNGQTVMVWPKNLWSYQHGDAQPDAPIFNFGEVWMVTSRGGSWTLASGDTVDIAWTFVDDGELLMTGGKNPYFPDLFLRSQKSFDAYEAQLTSLDAAGYSITTVTKMAGELKTLTTPAPPPPLLDGTWQPSSTDGARKWLGGGGLHLSDERDNDVHSLAAIAHRELVAARTASQKASIDASADIEAGFRLLALGEVSDASGINPFRGEVEYGIAHATEAMRIARAIINESKAKIGGATLSIDASAGSVAKDPPAPAQPTTIDAPIKLAIDGGDRQATLAWSKGERPMATITFAPGTSNTISVTVPGSPGFGVAYTPALTSLPVSVPLGGFKFDHYMLPLHDGLVGFATTRWLLQDQGYVHVAGRIDVKTGDVTFKDDTANADETITWVFHLVEGGASVAADAAKRLNVMPTVIR